MPHRFFLLLLLSWPFCTLSAAERIISLAPHATELVFAAGLGDKLIAVSDYSDYPESAKTLPRVANYQGINIERILTLQPDLVIVWPEGNAMREVEKLARLGIPLFYSHPKTLTDIADDIEKLSQYASDPTRGMQAANQFRQQLTQLEQKYAHLDGVRYFYQLSEKPIITLAQGSWPSEIFAFCGGVNIFQHSPSPYPQVSIEQVLLAKPEVIFTSEQAMAQGTMWQRWKNQVPAVKKRQITSLNADWLNRQTPRSLLAIEQVCNYFSQIEKY
ncbi:vitamin B12 ABC transporter substrate-binding protein BtuF [Vibrio sp. V31_P5A7T61]|uniref:vitamin B12 ABC transporter substrate-binding protein BtuF n=1 Tax=unclassified Vibrio TaxID=2614977 RepID=UPI001372545A|nr:MULTISPECIES: vitamin B12 ABC transporter substrate-binding protein BtuF [unclassified Vibrio]NAW61202.1 vitamin B12 ABC transporter substrate-binding protein BtuF [Vibrio sp. V31_P5A7T61]NAX03547.1 vitamin B12 ABC transporter substrate-binding protein BtuF [Vibrio sp. V34_P3A8T189]NAX08701.1 vitamin B12 ABC transporter substrate-binding protein BtuF [Vibrio sp. V40_P2S30T141]NAX65088.1 vitamin B12 ABC transporter substrate-binding protein BtuF [Vibrio sp. V32_P6A28T40]